MKIFSLVARALTLLIVPLLWIDAAAQTCNPPIFVGTTVIPPINENLNQMILSGGVRVTFRQNPSCNLVSASAIFASARIERISGGPLIIRRAIGPYSVPTQVAPTGLTSLSTAAVLDAIGNNNPNLITVSGVPRSSVTDANNNIVLPEGTYRICITAYADFPQAQNAYIAVSDSTTGCAVFTVPPLNPPNGITINTRFTPPANANIFQAIMRGSVVPTVVYNNANPARTTEIKLFGRIEALSPNPFTIETRPDYNTQQLLNLRAGIPVQLTAGQVTDAFANFNPADLKTTGISLDQLRDKNNNVILPEGVYRICFYAQYWKDGLAGLASNINLGCATFNICNKAGAPQFTQPVSNFTLSSAVPVVRVGSPVIFSWTPPVATCGLNMSTITYDFEIREMFESQTVTDAINNPPVFLKPGLRSATFLLDTMLNKQVLQRGKLYVIRVKANSPMDAPIIIDNGGYSRVQAFRYGEGEVITENPGTKVDPVRRPSTSLITTSTLKGRAVWSFKKAEEELPSTIFNPALTGVAELATNYTGQVLTPSENKTAVQNAIDPNLRVASVTSVGTGVILTGTGTSGQVAGNGTNAQVTNTGVKAQTTVITGNAGQVKTTPPTYSTAPQQMLLTTVMGDGQTTELKDLKIPSANGKETNPLAGAKIFIRGVKSAAGGQTTTRVATDNPKPATGVSLPVQLGIINAAGQPVSGNKAGDNKSAATGSKPVNNSASMNAPVNAALTGISPNLFMMDESKLEEDLIASGTSDASGNFVINFIDPKFRNITRYSRLHITAEHEDFEKYSRFINVTSPEADGDIDLGDVQLLAKSYRYTATIDGFAKNTKIDLYCPSATFNTRAHYKAMIRKSSSGEKKTIAGREYTKIATLSNGETISKLFYQRGYNENLVLQINADGKEQYSAYVGVYPVSYGEQGAPGSGFGAGLDESKLVIGVKKKYTLKNQLPYIQGKVEVFIEDRNNMANSATIPNKGAVVTISFDKTKVVEEFKETVSGSGAPGTGGAGTVPNNAVGVNKVAVVTNSPVVATAGNKVNGTVTQPAAGNVAIKTNGAGPVVKSNGAAPAVKTTVAGPVVKTNGAGPAVNNIVMASDMRLVAEINPGIAAQVQSLFRYSTTTDEEGNYRIDKLPVLQEGYFFTVTVKSSDGLDTSAVTTKVLKRGDFQDINFQFRPEVFTVTGIAVDEAGTPLTDALLLWKSGGMPIEAAGNGLFITSNYKDDSLTIKNQGYIDKTIFVKLDKSKPAANNKGKGVNNTVNTPLVVDNSKQFTSWSANLVTQPSVQQSVLYTQQLTSIKPNGAGSAPQTGAVKPATGSIPQAGGVKPSAGNTPQSGGTAPASGSPATVSASTFGYAVSKSVSSSTINAELLPLFSDLFKGSLAPQGSKDLGKVGYLQKGSTKINFVVSDAVTKAKIANAMVTIDETYDTVTDNTGEVLYKGGGSAFTYTVGGAAGSDYIIQTGDVGSLPVDGRVTTINVLLEHGVRLSGRITSKGKNIEGAGIFIDGRDFISTRSKGDGTYELFIPKGESTVKATKPGYTGKQVNKTFTSASVENFELGDGGGRNISKLLGFDIELESQVPDGTGEKWTGSFVNLKANSVFSVTASKKIRFSAVKVTFDGSGNPLVAGREVKTEATELPMKLYGFVPVSIKGSPQITVREEVPGKGTIGGRLQLNLDQVSTAGGFVFGNALKPLLVAAGSPIDKDVPVFTADGSSPDIAGFALSAAREDLKKITDKAVTDFQGKVDKATGEGKAALQAKLNQLKAAATTAASLVTGTAPIPVTLDQYLGVEVYGFQAMVNLAKCKIDASGLDMAGFVLSPGLPIMSSMFFDIERLKLGTDFAVKDISVKSNLAVKFSIASWSAEVNSVAFSMRGFKIGGKIEVQVPQSPKNTMEFANLAFGTSGLYGGSFSFPGNGLSIFNIINLKTGGTPLTFGEIGNSGVYKLGGSAKFSFGKMFSDNIEVPYFQIQTNGQFGVTVPVNRSLNAGFAKFALKSITFNTTTPSPQIDLDGQFSVDVKMIKLAAGGIHFRTSGVTVDKIGLGLDIPGTKVDGYLDLKENGFAGGGNLSVVGTPVKVKVDFHYFKTPGGVDVGASFIAGVKIPIGPVIITKVGGGFTYRSNPEFFSVTITGGASITGFEEAISLDPISITVESGPKLVGEAHLKVGPLDVAQAKLVLDIPNEYFALGIVADFQPLPDLIKAHLQGDLIISTKSSDTYFFLGAGINVDLFGLIRSEGVFALGFGVKNAQTRETISYYMAKAPSDYLSNGTFTGIYVNGVSEMGVKKQDAPELDLIVISGKLWLHSRSDFSLIANFNNGNFRIAAGMSFEGGIRGCFTFVCAEASAKACVNVAGGYNDSKGWNFSASASGEAVLAAGSSCGCNDICIGFVYAGGKICVGAGAKIRFESRTGGLKELSMYIGSRSVCP